MEKDKRQYLINLAKKYVDENNSIDITKFRMENPSEYSLIPHYFGSINQMTEQQGWIKVIKTSSKHGERLTLRDRLAHDMIKEMRDNGMTLEQIAQRYSASRAGVNQLYKALGTTIEKGNE